MRKYGKVPRRGDVRREVLEVQGGSRRRERMVALRKQGGVGKKQMRGIERRNRDENIFARPDGLRENAATAISCS